MGALARRDRSRVHGTPVLVEISRIMRLRDSLAPTPALFGLGRAQPTMLAWEPGGDGWSRTTDWSLAGSTLDRLGTSPRTSCSSMSPGINDEKGLRPRPRSKRCPGATSPRPMRGREPTRDVQRGDGKKCRRIVRIAQEAGTVCIDVQRREYRHDWGEHLPGNDATGRGSFLVPLQ